MTLEEQKENRRVWCEALRSGKYPQGTSRLIRKIDGVPHYCCWGVACEVNKFDRSSSGLSYIIGGNCATVSFPAYLALQLYGIASDNLGELESLNDNGKTFNEIADIIEAMPYE